VPYYYPLKFIVLVWLIYPESKGAAIIYDEHLKPFMEKHGKGIEEMISAMKKGPEGSPKKDKDS
jgi:hypothetical protein